MNLKRYRIVIAAGATFTDIINGFVENPLHQGFEAFKRIMSEFKAQMSVDPENFARKNKDTWDRLTVISDALDTIATHLNVTPQAATGLFVTGAFANFEPQQLANFFQDAFRSANGLGLTGSQVPDFLQLCLRKNPNDAELALTKFKESMSTIKAIATNSGITPGQAFEIVFDSVNTGNQNKLNALINITPLLNVNWGKLDTANINSVISSLDGLLNLKKINLDPSEIRNMRNSYLEALNKMKVAFRGIQRQVDMLNINREIERFNNWEKKFTTDPAYWINLNKEQQDFSSQFAEMRAYRIREMKTNQAPIIESSAPDRLEQPPTVKSNVIKKFRIVASPPNPSADLTNTANQEAYTQFIQELNLGQKKIQSKIELITISDGKLSEYFKNQYANLGKESSNYVELIISALDTSSVEKEFNNLKKLVLDSKKLIEEQKYKLKTVFDNVDLDSKIKNVTEASKLSLTGYEKLIRDFDVKLYTYGIYMKVSKEIKSLDDSINAYETRKGMVTPNSTEVFVEIKDYNGNFLGIENRFNFIVDTFRMGESIATDLKNLGNKILRSAGGSENLERTGERIIKNSIKFSTQNRAWKDSNLPKLKMVGEIKSGNR
jgi:hypothetical protein